MPSHTASERRKRKRRSKRKKVVSRSRFDEIVARIERSGAADNPYAVAHSRFRKKGER